RHLAAGGCGDRVLRPRRVPRPGCPASDARGAGDLGPPGARPGVHARRGVPRVGVRAAEPAARYGLRAAAERHHLAVRRPRRHRVPDPQPSWRTRSGLVSDTMTEPATGTAGRQDRDHAGGLATQGLAVGYRTRSPRRRRASRPVLSGLDLEARAGELTVLLGPNGAGKST